MKVLERHHMNHHQHQLMDDLSVHIYGISSDEYDTGAAKHSPLRFESSEDESEYFPYSNSFFSEADSDGSIPLYGDLHNEGKDDEQQQAADCDNEKDEEQQ
ncbi:hypothetical protein ACOSQ3_024277 [Xanthoceras sorbifolium]